MGLITCTAAGKSFRKLCHLFVTLWPFLSLHSSVPELNLGIFCHFFLQIISRSFIPVWITNHSEVSPDMFGRLKPVFMLTWSRTLTELPLGESSFLSRFQLRISPSSNHPSTLISLKPSWTGDEQGLGSSKQEAEGCRRHLVFNHKRLQHT